MLQSPLVCSNRVTVHCKPLQRRASAAHIFNANKQSVMHACDPRDLRSGECVAPYSILCMLVPGELPNSASLLHARVCFMGSGFGVRDYDINSHNGFRLISAI